MTPLHVASLWGHIEIVKLIRSKMEDTEDKDPQDTAGNTPTMYYKLNQQNKRQNGGSQFLWHPWLTLFKIVFRPNIRSCNSSCSFNSSCTFINLIT
jgi:hypothetical protein